MKLFLGDCLEVMHDINKVDMILADLPFGRTQCPWDKIIPFEPLWEHYDRIIKPNGAIVLFGSQPFTSILITSNLSWFRYAWVWEKNSITGYLDAKRKPLKQHEDLPVFSKKRTVYFPQMTPTKRVTRKRWGKPDHYGKHERQASDNQGFAYPRSVLHFATVPPQKRLHPTEKPVPLLKYLIETYTKPGEMVLDNVMGSGSTGEACLLTGREFIGIEIDSVSFQKAKDRINRVMTTEPDFTGLPLFQAEMAL